MGAYLHFTGEELKRRAVQKQAQSLRKQLNRDVNTGSWALEPEFLTTTIQAVKEYM